MLAAVSLVASRARKCLLVAAMAALTPVAASGDEGGVGFWLPGLYGSLAAVPSAPGWSFAAFYYHSSVSAGGNADFPQGGGIWVGLDGDANLLGLGPTYTLARPVLGGQVAISLLGTFGRNEASVEATLSGPDGNEVSGARASR